MENLLQRSHQLSAKNHWPIRLNRLLCSVLSVSLCFLPLPVFASTSSAIGNFSDTYSTPTVTLEETVSGTEGADPVEIHGHGILEFLENNTPLTSADAETETLPGNVENPQSVSISALGLSESQFITKISQGVYEVDIDAYMDAIMEELFPQSIVDKYSIDDTLAIVQAAAVKDRLLEQIADSFDFAVFTPTAGARQALDHYFTVVNGTGVIGLGFAQKDDVDGIGFPSGILFEDVLNDPDFAQNRDDVRDPFMKEVNDGGALQEAIWLEMENISNVDWLFEPSALERQVLLHEYEHRWGISLGTGGNWQIDPLGILGRGGTHWSPFFDTDQSPFDGVGWEDLGDGTFRMTHFWGVEDIACITNLFCQAVSENIYNDFELYTMGLLPKEEVRSSFVIENPTTLSGTVLTDDNFTGLLWNSGFLANPVIQGTRRDVTIQDVVALEGDRDPLSAAAQKDFSTAFFILKDESDSSSVLTAMRDRVTSLAEDLSALWQQATRGLSTMVLGPTAAGFQLFKDKVLSVFDQSVEDSVEIAPPGTPSLAGVLAGSLQTASEKAGMIEAYQVQLQNDLALLDSAARTDRNQPYLEKIIAEYRAQIEDLENQLSNLSLALGTAIAEAETVEDYVRGKRNALGLLADQGADDGILPAGFGAAAAELTEDVREEYERLIVSLENFSSGTQNGLDQLADDFARIQGLFDFLGVRGISESQRTDFSSAALSPLSGWPSVGTLTSSGQIQITSRTYEQAVFHYNLPQAGDSAMAEISWGAFDGQGWFYGNPQDLRTFTLGLAGSAGSHVTVEVVDKNARMAVFDAELTGSLQNYTFTLAGDNLPPDFNITKIAKIRLKLNRETSGSAGDLTIRTLGLSPVPDAETVPFNEEVLSVLYGKPKAQGVMKSGSGEVTAETLSRQEAVFHYVLDNSSSVGKAQLYWDWDHPQDLRTFTLALEGEAGRNVTAEVVDKNGKRTYFDVLLTGKLQNYTFPLEGANIPTNYNITKIVQINFIFWPSKAGQNGTLRLRTQGLDALPEAVASAFSENALSTLNGNPAIETENGPSGGTADVELESTNQAVFTYQLSDADDSAVGRISWGTFDELGWFHGNPQDLRTFTLALQGPAGRTVEVEVIDKNGRKVTFLVNLTGTLTNYTFPLTEENLPLKYNITKIAHINILLQASGLGISSGSLRLMTS